LNNSGEWKKQIIYFMSNKWYLISVVITAFMSYGFTIANPTVSTDDLSMDYYFRQGGLLSQGRFTQILIDKVLGIYHFRPFVLDGLAVICLIIAAILWCSLFRKVTGEHLKIVTYIVFSCFFISYPLINEIFIYMSASFSVCLGHALIPLILILLYEEREYLQKGKIFLISILICFTISLYESLVAVYIFGVFAILILQYFYRNRNKRVKEIASGGIYYIFILGVGIFLFGLLNKIIFLIGGISQASGANKIIYWGNGFIPTTKKLIKELVLWYGLNAFQYLPITILVIAVFISIGMLFFFSIRDKSLSIALLFFCCILSLILLSILQGSATAYRACLVFSVFSAFIFMLLLQFILERNKKFYIGISSTVLFILLIWQMNDINKWFYCDYLRYEVDVNTARLIGNELQADFDIQKPVVFVGHYQLPDNINELTYIKTDSVIGKLLKKNTTEKYMYKFNQANGNSFLEWSTGWNFPGNVSNIHLFFRFLGYDIVADNETLRAKAKELSKDKPKWPKSGSIFETEEFIVVNFGNY